MASHLPPIPPDNRSKAGPGEDTRTRAADQRHADTTVNPDKKGHQANSKINTTHQGLQQDR